MRKIRDIAALMLVCALVVTTAWGAGVIETDREAGLTLTCRQEGRAVTGVTFALYRAADVDPYGAYTLTGDFRDYPVLLDGQTAESWRLLARTLAGYVRRDGLTPQTTGTTDENGRVEFGGLRPGLYLALAEPMTENGEIFTAEPFLAALPELDTASNTWNYQVQAAPKFTVEPVPPEPVDRQVVKIWNDGGSAARPASVIVQLLKNGAVYDTVKLSEENSWRYGWTDLPAMENGQPVDWQVTELTPEGYTVTVSREGETFLVTNTGHGSQNPGEPTLPQTGSLWWPVPLLAACGLICLALGARRRRHD